MTPQAAQMLARLFADSPLLRRREYDESQHPRDEDGKWTDAGGGGGGGGGGSSDKPAASSESAKLDPKLTDVGGDEWNQKTAVKLEREFQAARPKIEALEQRAIGNVEDTSDPSADDDNEDEDTVYMPEEWDSLTSDDQTEAADEYVDKSFSDYHDNEVQNWADSGGALDAAKTNLADNFVSAPEWAVDAIDAVRDARDEAGEPPIPYTNNQLFSAINVAYESDGEGRNDPEITFDDAYLKDPQGYDPAQGTLPGVEPLQPHEMLSDKSREEIEKALLKAFDKQAESDAGDMDPPDYLADSAKEFAAESWSMMPDSDKFEWVQSNTNILEKYEQDSDGGSISEMKIDKLPDKYDPLNNTSGDDYKRTQALARYLSRERSEQILGERGLDVPSDQELRRIDNTLWKSWKESSTSDDGKLIQLATAEELGGRLNAKTRADIDPEAQRARADKIYDSVGGYAGVKALIRAKWEVTQHLLSKAGEDELQLYRGLTLDKALVEKIFGKHVETGRKVGSFTHLPTMDVKRNGAASTTTALSVANGWGGHGGGKVVLRAVVPRTAAVSIPAYGINVKSEQEVVIAGTAWKGWDVWQGQAPGLGGTPLQKHT
jgi:hypothetical protein